MKTKTSLFARGSNPWRSAAFCSALLLSLCSPYGAAAPKQVELLDRGLVAIPAAQGNFVSWRLLANDAPATAFNLYRNGQLISRLTATGATSFLDTSGGSGAQYTVRPVVNGVEGQASSPSAVWANAFKRVPLKRPAGGTTPRGEAYDYSPNDASVADLDGDGEYEILLKWYPSNAKDNSQSGYTGPVYLDAYKLDGRQMWRIDLGRNIRAGAHYTQFIAYDLDGDGKAEVATKTADGTVDGQGKVIGNAAADHRNTSGYILSGPEFLTVFDGASGRALTTVDYVPARGTVSSWGDSYGNRVDRFLAGVAYLDGERPSLIMARGYYTRAVVAAWDWRGGRLTQRWVFDSHSGNTADRAYAGQGAHSLSVGDVDQDGRDEIVYGAATIDDNGRGLYSTGLGHGDALHLADINPDSPGLEVFMIHESPSSYGVHGTEVHQAATGKIIWSVSGNGQDVGRGVTMDVDPRHRGYESWSSQSGGLIAANGTLISARKPGSTNFGVYWDGDLQRELLDDTKIDKWDYAAGVQTRLLTAYTFGAASNNGTKATPALSADVFGDWREEVIWRNGNNQELLIFSTAIPTAQRLPTLMHDPQYRAAVAWQNVGYNQPPHTSYAIGAGMAMPRLDVRVTGNTAIGGDYAVINRHSGLALDVAERAVGNGANVWQWPYIGGTNQIWRIANLQNGYYRLSPTHAVQQALDIQGVYTTDGANAYLWQYWGGENQQFKLVDAGGGYYTLVARHSGKCLDVIGRSTQQGGNVAQWTCNGGYNQQWRLQKVR